MMFLPQKNGDAFPEFLTNFSETIYWKFKVGFIYEYRKNVRAGHFSHEFAWILTHATGVQRMNLRARHSVTGLCVIFDMLKKSP